ncbi:hypothetical protein [Cystobacter fuscus]|uniref:hypothetical protein n=1 Tax=Cystobacter fuscus TaxID=43 RepID=UPI002B2BED47|nr:hypothetical protein F0U63_14355 [Cystobacter fuscus]
MPTPSPQASPRALLDALRAGTPLPGFPSDAVERARPFAAEPASAPPALVESLPEPLALALLEGSVQAGQPALAEALAGSAHKPLAKAAKKALYQLRSRGVPLAPPTRPAEPARSSAPAPESFPALLTSIDGTGERVLELARPLRGGGLEAIQVLYSDEHGVTRLQVNDMSRGDYRRAVKQATAPGAQTAVELPQAEARERLAQAVGLNVSTGTPFPPGLDAVLRHLEVRPLDKPLEIPPPEPEDERLAAEAHALHDEEEMRGWLPPLPELERLAHTVAELRASPLALTPAQRNAEILQAAHVQARAFFSAPRMRRLFAGRLWEMGLHFERLGQERPARLARAEARRLAHGPPDTPSRFAERLYEKALLVTLARRMESTPGERGEGPEHPRSAPPSPPGTPPGERRSPGGIILP